jgi:prolipoprotein diacylglyceryltransferase
MYIYVLGLELKVAYLFWAVGGATVWLFADAFLESETALTHWRRRGMLAACLLIGLLGGIVQGKLHAWAAGSVLGSSFGSLGVLVGILVGAACLAALGAVLEPARWLSAILFATFTGLGIARIGCLFNGCCKGATLHNAAWHLLEFLSAYWPALDIGALAVATGILYWGKRQDFYYAPGVALVGYGVSRFLLEFLRPMEGRPISVEQVFTIVLVVLGAFCLFPRFGRNDLEQRSGAALGRRSSVN